ncbi:MAG TPA: hypothetical protein VEA61_01635 [Allosphingosinicella sp.]|nr:hypothetical protein [Allosphingosinicella sp.]
MRSKGLCSPEPLGDEPTAAMIERLRERDLAAEAAASAVPRCVAAGDHPRDEAGVRDRLAVAGLMLAGGKFTEAEHCFYCVAQVNCIHESRWLGGAYDKELRPIQRAMEEIERAHGLEEDEYFDPDDAPDDWRALDRAFEAVLDGKLDAVLDEFGLSDLLALRRRDREQYERLWETGRLAFFEKSNAEANLLNLIRVCEREAKRAAAAEAYFAALSMLARAAEARLALHCLRRPEVAREAAARLPDRLRPAVDDPLRWTAAELAGLAAAGGWLHNLPDERLVTALVAWLGQLPPERPGQQALEGVQPWLGKTEFQASLDAYSALRTSLDLASRAFPDNATLQ